MVCEDDRRDGPLAEACTEVDTDATKLERAVRHVYATNSLSVGHEYEALHWRRWQRPANWRPCT